MLCCICQREITTTDPRRYYCWNCWSEWNAAILSKEPWVTYCINYEHRQRRQELKDQGLIYLGDEFEIGEFDGEYGLVPNEEHFENWG